MLAFGLARGWRSVRAWALVAGCAAVILTGSSVSAQDKPSEAELQKAREEVKKRTAEMEKAFEQMREAGRKLWEAREKLNKLEGRPGYRSPWFGRPPSGPGRGAPERPAPMDPARAAELEKKLDRILKDVEELRREIRKPAPPSKPKD